MGVSLGNRLPPTTPILCSLTVGSGVACTLNAILQGSLDMTIVVHDFWNRPKYAVLLDYLNCACRADSLAVFFPKSTINPVSLRKDLARYATSPV
jgi:hypothetical protein